MTNPAVYQLGDNFDPPADDGMRELEDHEAQCEICDEVYDVDEDSTFETSDMAVCSMCAEGKAEELNGQIDYAGMESLTEDEQAFIEWWGNEI